MFKCKRGFTYRTLIWTFFLVTGHMPHQIWVERILVSLVAYMTFEMCWFGQWHSLWKTKQPIILNLYCPICVEIEWNSDKLYMVYGIVITRHLSRKYQTLSQSYYTVFVRFCSTVWYKRPVWKFELRGVGDCGLVNGYFIFIECYISHIRSFG